MKPTHRKNLKSFFVVVLILLGLTVIILYFIFRPRPPVVIPTPVSLLHFEFNLTPKVILNVIIGVDVLVSNPNLAPFKYDSSLVTVYYRHECVGEAAVPADTIQAHGTKDIGTPVELLVDRLIDNPKFLSDVTDGVMSLVATSTTKGQAVVLGFVKLHMTISVECVVSLFLYRGTIASKCVSKIDI